MQPNFGQACRAFKVIFAFTLFALATELSASSPADAVNGIWLDPGKGGYIQIYEDHDSWLGIVVGSADGEVKNDDNNPDPVQRSRTLLGQSVIRNLVYDGKGHWQGGTIYNPLDGRTYSVSLSLADADTLEVRGYIGVPLLGQTRRWVRVTDLAAPGLQTQALIRQTRSQGQ